MSLLEPFTGVIGTGKNETQLSRLCESVVATFLNYRASSARVKAEELSYDTETLYQSLYTICRRKSLQGAVSVHKQNGQIILIRNGGANADGQ